MRHRWAGAFAVAFMLGARAGWAAHATACVDTQAVVLNDTLSVIYCLERHEASADSGIKVVRHVRRSLVNKGGKAIEVQINANVLLSLEPLIGYDGTLVSRVFVMPAADTPEAESFRLEYRYLRLAPGQRSDEVFQLSNFMLEKPDPQKLYSIELNLRFPFRFEHEPRSAFVERSLSISGTQNSMAPLHAGFRDVRIR
jgi:hypothetical protein